LKSCKDVDSARAITRVRAPALMTGRMVNVRSANTITTIIEAGMNVRKIYIAFKVFFFFSSSS
jgi:hypothetical protein